MTQWLVDQLRAGWGPGEFCVSAIPVILPDFTIQLRCEDSRIWWRLSLGTLWRQLIRIARALRSLGDQALDATPYGCSQEARICDQSSCTRSIADCECGRMPTRGDLPHKSRLASPPVVQDSPIDRARGLADEVGLFTLVNQGVYE